MKSEAMISEALKSKLILPGFAALSMLLVAYAPMATFASAQSATDAKAQALKTKIESVLNSRIQSLQDTLKNIGVDVQVAPGISSVSTSNFTGTVTHTCQPDSTGTGSPSPSVSPSAGLTLQNGQLTGSIELGCGIISQSKTFIKGMITDFTNLLGNVQGTNDLSTLQNLGQNTDNQGALSSLFSMFGLSSQSISSLTGVLDNLKSTWNDMSKGVSQMKDCAKTIFGNLPGQSASPSASPNSGANVTVDSNGVTVDCGQFHLSSSDIVTQAQNILNAVLPIIEQIGSMLLSAVVQMLPMLLSMTSMLGSMGGLSSLTSGGGLGSMGGLQQMLPMLTMLPMMLLPMVSMISQLGTAGGVGGGSLSSLTSLGSLIGI